MHLNGALQLSAHASCVIVSKREGNYGQRNRQVSGILDLERRVQHPRSAGSVRFYLPLKPADPNDAVWSVIRKLTEKRLGLKDVEADIIGRSYQYLIRKFAEGSGQSAGEFFTPPEVARVMALIMDPDPGMSVYDPCCGSAGLLIACEHALDDFAATNRCQNPLFFYLLSF